MIIVNNKYRYEIIALLKAGNMRVDVAVYCNLSYSQLSNYLNGMTPMTYTLEKKIREYINKRRTEIEKAGAK